MAKTHRLFHNKRGISEIIASLILVLIISAAGSLVYSISLTMFSSSTNSYQSQTSQREAEAQERLKVLSVQWDGSINLDLTVLNYGLIDLTIDKVYINGVEAASYSSGIGIKTAPSVILSVSFASPASITAGQTYDIIVASERGSKNEISWQA
jgi:flagellin-like protein